MSSSREQTDSLNYVASYNIFSERPEVRKWQLETITGTKNNWETFIKQSNQQAMMVQQTHTTLKKAWSIQSCYNQDQQSGGEAQTHYK